MVSPKKLGLIALPFSPSCRPSFYLMSRGAGWGAGRVRFLEAASPSGASSWLLPRPSPGRIGEF
eukprot:scaffold57399_cov30-Tisochrysis_lutea.AAC.4